MHPSIAEYMAEEGTGIRARKDDGGQLYDDRGNKISDTEARRQFRAGMTIAAPNAGAGSYNAVLKRLGYTSVKVEEWGSSAGDWTFRVRGHYVSQANRYPNYGFKYTLCTF